LGAAVTPARSAETKVRFWAGTAANCLAVWRRARAAGLEAIVNVRRGYLGFWKLVWGKHAALNGVRLAWNFGRHQLIARIGDASETHLPPRGRALLL
jgi:hypothetical protein